MIQSKNIENTILKFSLIYLIWKFKKQNYTKII